MNATHRLLIVILPVLLCTLSVLFLMRADRKFDGQMKDLQELRRDAGSATGEPGTLFSSRQEELLSAARATQKSKSFWVVASVFSAFFMILALAFVFYEARHRKRRDQLIASFVSDESIQDTP